MSLSETEMKNVAKWFKDFWFNKLFNCSVSIVAGSACIVIEQRPFNKVWACGSLYTRLEVAVLSLCLLEVVLGSS